MILKKKVERVLTSIAAIVIAATLAFPQTVLAYDKSQYDSDEEYIYMDNFHGNPNHVLLYYVVRPDRYNQNNMGTYTFGVGVDSVSWDAESQAYYDNNPGLKIESLAFQFYAEDRDVVDQFEFQGIPYEVWRFQFGLEDGEYYFYGIDDNNHYTLDKGLELPKTFWTDNNKVVVGAAGESQINIYTFAVSPGDKMTDLDLQVLQYVGRVRDAEHYGYEYTPEDVTEAVEVEQESEVIEQKEITPVLQTVDTSKDEEGFKLDPRIIAILISVLTVAVMGVILYLKYKNDNYWDNGGPK